MIHFKKETQNFSKLTKEKKFEKIEAWVNELSAHYDYFADIGKYIQANKTELDEKFLNALFLIILNLAQEIEKI